MDNITVLSNQGKALIAVRDITTNVIEGYSERSVIYEMREPKQVYSSLDVDCVVMAETCNPGDEPLYTNLGKAVYATVRAMKGSLLTKMVG